MPFETVRVAPRASSRVAHTVVVVVVGGGAE
jgi:hypothetical protein